MQWPTCACQQPMRGRATTTPMGHALSSCATTAAVATHATAQPHENDRKACNRRERRWEDGEAVDWKPFWLANGRPAEPGGILHCAGRARGAS